MFSIYYFYSIYVLPVISGLIIFVEKEDEEAGGGGEVVDGAVGFMYHSV